MSKAELIFTDEEIDRFAEKIACKLKQLDTDCAVCSDDYHQEIVCTLNRHHGSNTSTSIIETKFCPNCGRLLNAESSYFKR